MTKDLILLSGLLTAVASMRGQSDPWQQDMQKAKALEQAGDYRSANAVLRDAVGLAEQSGSVSQRLLPPSLNALGLNYESLGRYTDAVPVYERTLAILEANNRREHADYAIALGNLSAVLIDLGQLQRAEGLLREAIAVLIHSSPEKEVPLAITRSTLAQCLAKRGQWGEAAALYEQDLAVFERHRDSLSIELGMALNNMGVVRANQGRHEESLAFLERSLDEMETYGGKTHPYLVEPLNNLATAYARLKRNAEADRSYRRAIAIAEAPRMTSGPVYGNVLANYAEFLRHTGHKREGAKMKSESDSVLAASRRANGTGMTVSALSFTQPPR